MGSLESSAPCVHVEQVSGTFSPALRSVKSKVMVSPALSPRRDLTNVCLGRDDRKQGAGPFAAAILLSQRDL